MTVGTTGKIMVSKNGWTYQGCTQCTKSAKSDGQRFTCLSGHYSEASIPRLDIYTVTPQIIFHGFMLIKLDDLIIKWLWVSC